MDCNKQLRGFSVVWGECERLRVRPEEMDMHSGFNLIFHSMVCFTNTKWQVWHLKLFLFFLTSAVQVAAHYTITSSVPYNKLSKEDRDINGLYTIDDSMEDEFINDVSNCWLYFPMPVSVCEPELCSSPRSASAQPLPVLRLGWQAGPPLLPHSSLGVTKKTTRTPSTDTTGHRKFLLCNGVMNVKCGLCNESMGKVD